MLRKVERILPSLSMRSNKALPTLEHFWPECFRRGLSCFYLSVVGVSRIAESGIPAAVSNHAQKDSGAEVVCKLLRQFFKTVEITDDWLIVFVKDLPVYMGFIVGGIFSGSSPLSRGEVRLE